MKTPKINVKYLGQNFTLTQRVIECLILTALGFPIKHTASRLGISYRTTEKHIRNAKEKIGIHNHNQLIDFLFSSQISNRNTTKVKQNTNNIDSTRNMGEIDNYSLSS